MAKDLTLPDTADWANWGIAISEGAEGEWDRYLWGGFANSLIKRDATYYFYYQGSPSYDETCGSVTQRAIGVATSPDGIHWTKYSGNPIITWSDGGSVEEGAVSSGVILGNNGQVYIYYGANSGTSCAVTSAGRLAQSSDGLHFIDQGEVIPPTAPLWGSGDEIFPVGAYTYDSSWFVFYIPNGVPEAERLGVISGANPTILDPSSSGGINDGTLPAWGPVAVVPSGPTAYAFVNDPGANLPLRAYSFAASVPSSMALEKTYVFSDCVRSSVLYETDMDRWVMLCRDKATGGFYRVKIAGEEAPAPSLYLPLLRRDLRA